MKEVVISDDKNAIIDKAEIAKKVTKLEGYINRVNNRIQQVNKEIAGLLDQSEKAKVEAGLKYFHLNSAVSKSI